MRGGKKDQGQLPHPQRSIVWLAQSPGARRAGGGGGCGAVGKEPPRLHLHRAGDGNYPKCNICAGEMAEGLLHGPITANKGSIYPNDKGWGKGKARGHQMRANSCKCSSHPRRAAPVCSRMGTGEPGMCQNLSLWGSRDCPDVSLPAGRAPSCCAFLYLHLQGPPLLKHLPISTSKTDLDENTPGIDVSQ